jgi:pyruvate formate lyase activating enzyme
VLENFRRLVENGVHVIPRVPLIPGFTLCEKNFSQILSFLAPFALPDIHLLPFHQYGEPKYSLLGKRWAMAKVGRHRQQKLTDSLSWLNKLVFA